MGLVYIYIIYIIYIYYIYIYISTFSSGPMDPMYCGEPHPFRLFYIYSLKIEEPTDAK